MIYGLKRTYSSNMSEKTNPKILILIDEIFISGLTIFQFTL